MTDDNENIESNENVEPSEPKPAPTGLSAEELLMAQQELQNYRRALDEEFADAAEKAVTSEEVMDTTIEYFKKSVPDVAAQIVFLSANSTSDGVRLNACKYVIDCVRKGVADSVHDPVTDILNNIFSDNDKKREADTSDLVQDEEPGQH